MSWNTCFKCRCKMWIDDPLNEAALNARGKIAFYCSYGHEQYYVAGETEEQKLRRERDRLAQRVAQVEDERNEAQMAAAKAERATKRLKKRAAAGTCPCCQRTFANMTAHMKGQHPEFIADNVVKLKQAK